MASLKFGAHAIGARYQDWLGVPAGQLGHGRETAQTAE